MNQPELWLSLSAPSDTKKKNKEPPQPKEYKVVAIRECPTPASIQLCDTPEKIADYWTRHIKTHPYYTSDREYFVVVFLNTRRKVKGHTLVSIGLLDTILVHPREVFRAAIVASSSAVVLAHNHPSGDPTPSDADLKVTRDLIRAGQLLKIEVIDHVIMGSPSPEQPRGFMSLRELGYFA
jgi:DNA repair protein RadC